MTGGVNDVICRKLKKDVRLIVHEHLSHGYLGHYELKDYEVYVEEACELIRELINCGETYDGDGKVFEI